ncbi:PAS domain-containing sensor histidine kinase [Jeotgalibacillus sp. S-D1]|uniref:PAS domain-containing sensor histidine kinase n=1 Tax=Jeotgalibacillus sp. S-D1 TaxID=2552189 RepID=UPI001059B021|nr:PAS domain-containing sensor histidine kinase [Jeotgalibacillus sp. S-D1]TDL31137.1 PAS domain-containing sensor histidine kinase [Jeotgalibacillus sp. S-D1]
MGKYSREIKQTLSDTGMVYKFTIKDDCFIHTFCDGELLYKLGFEPRDIVGKTLFDFYPADYAAEKLEYYKIAWGGEPCVFESYIAGFSYICTLRPVFHKGKVIEVIGTSINISDRKVLEEESQQIENLSRTVLETMSEGIFLEEKNSQDNNIKVTALNKNVELQFGIKSGYYNEDTLLDMGIEFINEEGIPLSYWDLPGIITMKLGISFNNFIMGKMNKNEGMRWYSVNSKPFNNPLENRKGTLVSFKDITDQKEQEIKLIEAHEYKKSLLNTLNSGVFVTNRRREITAINSSMLRMLCLDGNSNQYIGTYAPSLFFIFKRPEVFLKFLNSISETKQSTVIELETENNKILECKYFPLFIHGDFIGNTFELIDITEHKKMEIAINKSKEVAEKANKAKSDFLSKMSHELRTPLNGILGFAQLLELEKGFDENHQDSIQEILKAGRHLLKLINDILDLSRIENGNLQVNTEEIYFDIILEDCIKLLRPIANKNNVTILNQTDAYKNISIKGDAIRLKQVFLNLLDNAIKYNRPNGKVYITCNLAKNYVVFRIKDTGQGIPLELQKKVFDPFIRLSTAEEGTGIGLSITEQLIKSMGGKIGVSSSEIIGCEFWFCLPISNQTNKQPHEPKEINDKVLYNKIPNAFQILYIEDNEPNRRLIEVNLYGEPSLSL